MCLFDSFCDLQGTERFFFIAFNKKKFFIILYPKNVKKGMSPIEVLSFVFVCFIFYHIFLK